MSPGPLISILLPCYNQARYLPQAIESVLAQRDARWELIVSDDASTDDSAEVVNCYAASDPRIRFFRQSPNLGMAANWNWCLRQANGHYVKFLFGDDYLCTPDALSSLASALEQNPGAILATSARLIVDENTRQQSITNTLTPDGRKPGESIITRCLLEGKNHIGEPSAVMFPLHAADRGFDPAYRQLIDLEYWAHLLEKGDLVYSSRPLSAFRRHNAQQTAVNRRTRAGEAEGVRLHVKYLSLLQRHLSQGGSPREFYRALFRTLYFSRKKSIFPADERANRQILLQILTPRRYAAYWLHHRVSKPFYNLGRAIQRSIQSRQS